MHKSAHIKGTNANIKTNEGFMQIQRQTKDLCKYKDKRRNYANTKINKGIIQNRRQTNTKRNKGFTKDLCKYSRLANPCRFVHNARKGGQIHG